MSATPNPPLSPDRRVVLASRSPRRHHLVETLGIGASIVVSDVDEEAVIAEEFLSGRDPDRFVRVLAERKAADVAGRDVSGSAIVIGADTIVVHDDAVLGKPTDREDARQMLRTVRNEWIRVASGVVVIDTASETVVRRTVTTPCLVDDFDETTLDRYLATDVWSDKAGALAVQHNDPRLIAAVDGCWANVAGLPICELALLLAAQGVAGDPATRCPGPAAASCTFVDAEF